jgi:hypothetical protein
MASMTAEEFDERFAYYQLSGEGDARYLAGLIAATIHNEMQRYMAAKGGQKLKQEDLHNPENYLPDAMRSKHRKKRRRIKATDANAAEIAARQLRAL